MGKLKNIKRWGIVRTFLGGVLMRKNGCNFNVLAIVFLLSFGFGCSCLYAHKWHVQRNELADNSDNCQACVKPVKRLVCHF